MVNAGYVIVKQLRKDGIFSDLLMEKPLRETSDPLSFDSSLQGKYPNWILFFNKKKWTWKIDIIKHMRNKKYDLIHAYVEFPIFANFTSTPFIAFTQGSDLRELAFTKSLKGILLKRAYKKAKAVLYTQPDHYPLLSKLNIKNGIFIPAPWDVDFFKPEQKQNNPYDNKFVIFHPSNLEWRLKGNDILLKGFSKFILDYPNSILLIAQNGIDRERTDKLIHELEISKNVKFIGPLSKEKMLYYYNLCDVVADQFILGSMGAVSLEAMLCEKPLLSFIEKSLHEQLYLKLPPVVIASNPNEIYTQLKILTNANLRTKLGTEGRKWVLANHSPQIVCKKLRIIYESILNNEHIKEIQEKILKS